MSPLPYLLNSTHPAPPLAAAHAERLAARLSAACSLDIYATSIAAAHGVVYALAADGLDKRLVIARRTSHRAAIAERSRGRSSRAAIGNEQLTLTVGATDAKNAAALREALPFLAPTTLGLRRSFGSGDRLGLATPAHVRAIRGSGVAPIFAQQSIREMGRTGRSPQQVMDDALWGVFQEGWRGGFGSDADHLKTPADVDRCARAGFTMFTVDPGDHVDDNADSDSVGVLAAKYAKLPWKALADTAADCRRRYLGSRVAVGDALTIAFTEDAFLRAAVKYGRAVAHTLKMYRRVAETMDGRPFELEMSVDETMTPTTVLEHYFVAAELRRLGVVWQSLAPRFIGEFEKGIDYKGDLDAFRAAFAQHVAIARRLGPYKISIHSGSDKFSIYPICAELAGDLLHVKTAGTSYLEALRALAAIEPALYRRILTFAFQRYPTDKASYHVSAQLDRIPRAKDLADADLGSVLDSNDGRQLLHVTYGSVLTATTPSGKSRFRDALLTALKRDEETHYKYVQIHIERHVQPLVSL